MDEFVSQKGLVFETPDLRSLEDRKNRKITILYGETYDEFGNTIDSMKYYLFLANLVDVLKSRGFETDARVLVADTAAVRNADDSKKEKVLQLGKQRGEFVERVRQIYNCNFRVQYMSEFIESEDFKKTFRQVKEICFANEDLKKMVRDSVPPDRLHKSEQNEYQYSLEEISTITGLDIKVGPPRERLYDGIANIVAERLGKQKLLPIYLTMSQPLGLQFDFFILNKDLEEYGLTPYKADSKGLLANRILPGKTTPEYARKIIQESFISNNPELPNPVLDMAMIAEMARQRLEGNIKPITFHSQFYGGKISSDDLKQLAAENVRKYIIDKFQTNSIMDSLPLF